MSYWRLISYGLLTVLIGFIISKQINTYNSFEAFTGSNTEIKNSTNDNLPVEMTNLQKPWYRNSLWGFSFETPEQIKKEPRKVPEGYESLINKLEAYGYQKDELIVVFLFMDSNFQDYDLETGLKGAIQNSVNTINGADLRLTYNKPNGALDDLEANGKFKWKGLDFLTKGYIYWNKKGKAAILFCIAKDSHEYQATVDRIINSRGIAF